MKCKECLTYTLCRERLLNYLNENYDRPYQYMEIYRAYYYTIRNYCRIKRNEYTSTITHQRDFDIYNFTHFFLEELSLIHIRGRICDKKENKM